MCTYIYTFLMQTELPATTVTLLKLKIPRFRYYQTKGKNATQLIAVSTCLTCVLSQKKKTHDYRRPE
jgi:hypothetical protein